MRETTIDAEFQIQPGEFVRLTPGFVMNRWEAEFGEESPFISDPGFSEDQEPDPELADLPSFLMFAEIDAYWRDAEDYLREQEQWRYRGDFY